MLSGMRYVIFGAVALACVQPAQSSVLNLTKMHQQLVSKSCAPGGCIIDFQKLPAGREAVIRRLFCEDLGTAANPLLNSLRDFYFETATTTGTIMGRTPVQASGGAHNFGELIHAVDSTQVMRVRVNNIFTSSVTARCMIVGEFLN